MSCVTKGCTHDAITFDDNFETENCVKFDDKCVTCDTVSGALKGKDPYEFFRDPVYNIFAINGAESKVKADLGLQIQQECNIPAPVERIIFPDIYHLDPEDKASIKRNAHEILHFYKHHDFNSAATQKAIRFVKILENVGALLKVRRSRY